MTTPLKFALVPVEPTDAMCGSIEYGAASRICETNRSERQYFLRKAISASHGNDLLERIVRALDDAKEHLWLNGPPGAGVEELIQLLDELGGGHG